MAYEYPPIPDYFYEHEKEELLRQREHWQKIDTLHAAAKTLHPNASTITATKESITITTKTGAGYTYLVDNWTIITDNPAPAPKQKKVSGKGKNPPTLAAPKAKTYKTLTPEQMLAACKSTDETRPVLMETQTKDGYTTAADGFQAVRIYTPTAPDSGPANYPDVVQFIPRSPKFSFTLPDEFWEGVYKIHLLSKAENLFHKYVKIIFHKTDEVQGIEFRGFTENVSGIFIECEHAAPPGLVLNYDTEKLLVYAGLKHAYTNGTTPHPLCLTDAPAADPAKHEGIIGILMPIHWS